MNAPHDRDEAIRKKILTHLADPDYDPVRSKELARDIGISARDYKRYRDILGDLKHEGEIVRLRGSRWGKGEDAVFLEGRIQLTRSGAGFLLPDDPEQDDLYIGENHLGDALSGDRVRVRLDTPRGQGFRHFGRVVEILERGRPRIVATVTPEGLAEPEDPKNPYKFTIRGDTPPVGHKILLEVTTWPGDGDPAGTVIEILGPAGAPDTEVAAILAGYDAPGPFPEDVKTEVRALAAARLPDTHTDRLDLRNLPTVTIDPTTARDFDDALSIEVNKDGNYVVGVHIADVSAFVTPDSATDTEARERSTSIYLPGRVIPMLPEELSNDLCSLRPQEDRFAKTVFIEYTPEGKRENFHIHRSVIRSRRRMTYEEVRDLLTHDTLADAFDDPLLMGMLRQLRDLAETLRQQRIDQGSLELDMPEFVILMDEEGHATDMAEVEHDFSHEMVAEFMLSANQCVAEWCVKNAVPVLHRVHEAPDEASTEDLAEFLNASGYPFKPPLRRERLQGVIAKAHGRPEQHAINLAILKSFKQAVYKPDGTIGHFALNFPRYMHFTSPIRRYPDLYLHQQLEACFSEGANKLPAKLHKLPARGGGALESLGVHTSGRERRAMKIENDVKDYRRLEFLSRMDERVFPAIVTGVRKFGIFVEIEHYLVEGMIPRHMVERHGYTTREAVPGEARRQGGGRGGRGGRGGGRDFGMRGFHLGQKVQVRITEIDLSARICQMDLLDIEPSHLSK